MATIEAIKGIIVILGMTYVLGLMIYTIIDIVRNKRLKGKDEQ